MAVAILIWFITCAVFYRGLRRYESGSTTNVNVQLLVAAISQSRRFVTYDLSKERNYKISAAEEHREIYNRVLQAILERENDFAAATCQLRTAVKECEAMVLAAMIISGPR